MNSSLIVSSISDNRRINTTEIFTNNCYKTQTIIKRTTDEHYQFGRYIIYLFIHANDFLRSNFLNSNNI